jgi:hypothetical protein
MIETAARIAVGLAGAWLIAVALLMASRPDRALAVLAAMGSTWAIQLGEHLPRLAAGIAFVLAAPASKAPDAFRVFGWFLAASSVVILLAPKAWHARYARYWAARIPLWAARALAPFSAAAGAIVIWAVL